MPSPELRCLECNRQFADLTADQEVERCGECGKFVVAAPTLLTTALGTPPAADVVAEEDIPTVGKAKGLDDDLPLAQPVRPAAPPAPPVPAWARRADNPPSPAKPAETMRPAFAPRPATTPRPRAEVLSNTELPNQTEGKKQKIGLALFVALLFFLAVLVAVAVLGYTIIRGLQMKKVLTEAAPTTGQPLSRASDS